MNKMNNINFKKLNMNNQTITRNTPCSSSNSSDIFMKMSRENQKKAEIKFMNNKRKREKGKNIALNLQQKPSDETINLQQKEGKNPINLQQSAPDSTIKLHKTPEINLQQNSDKPKKVRRKAQALRRNKFSSDSSSK